MTWHNLHLSGRSVFIESFRAIRKSSTGVSENSVPLNPNGFADHYPYEKWLFHWEYTLFSDTPISDAFWYPKTCRQTLIRFDRHFHEAAGERQINTLKQLIASDLPRGGDLWAIYLIYPTICRGMAGMGHKWNWMVQCKDFPAIYFCRSIDTRGLSHTRHVFDCLMVISPKYWTVHLYFSLDIEVIYPHPVKSPSLQWSKVT